MFSTNLHDWLDEFIKNQEPMPQEVQEILKNGYWELLEDVGIEVDRSNRFSTNPRPTHESSSYDR